MGVHFQRGAGVRVAQARGHCHDVDAVGQQDGGVGVPLRYNYDKPEKPRISKVFVRMFFRFMIMRYGSGYAIPHFLSRE